MPNRNTASSRAASRRQAAAKKALADQSEVYQRIAGGDDFIELRRRYRSFAFPATIAFMVWYITYVACNNWARDFMRIQVIGNINVAVVFGLLQFLSTFAIAFFYSRHANKSLDPLATQLREKFESETHR